ncbi:MAG: putative glycosyl transferase, family 2 [Ferruginibacter sp.]|nr:putative glycosyl transferase, family 2 [Ferruginibacter sp.]
MKVSIIIPNYNHSKFLKQRIDSIINQTFRDFEIIILDDNSTDDSRIIIENYRLHDKVKSIIYNDVNSGNTFKQWEKGIEQAKGELLWIAESDDWCDDCFLEVMVHLLEKDEAISIAYCKSHMVTVEGFCVNGLDEWYRDLSRERWNNDYINEGNDEIKKYLSVKNTIPNASAVLFRRTHFEIFKELPTNYKLCGDWLFWIKMLVRNKIAYTTKCSNFYRIHDRTVRMINKNKYVSVKEKIKIYKYLMKTKLISKNVLEGKVKKEILGIIRSKNLRNYSDVVTIFDLLKSVFWFKPILSFTLLLKRLTE